MTRRLRAVARTRRILIVAPNWLGDAVMITPLLTRLDTWRRAAGGPRLVVALSVREAWAHLFAGDPRLDELLVTERPGRHDGLRGLVAQAVRWRQGRFDAVLLGPPSLRAALTAAIAGIPLRIGHRGDGRTLLLTRALRRAPRGTRHFTREMMDLGDALGSAWALAPRAPAGDAPLATSLATVAVAAEAVGSRPLWAVGPGTTFGPAKNWPAGPLGAFVAAAVAGQGVRVVMLGDAGAAPALAEIRASWPALRWTCAADAVAAQADADVIDLTGRTSLVEAVGWLGRAQLYVGNDSGLMHVAAAMGTPTVGLFGSSSPEWTRPVGPRVAVIAAEGFACRPCYRRTCNQPVFCLATVDAGRVLAAARDLLADGAGGEGRWAT